MLTESQIIALFQQAMWTTLSTAGPIIGAALVVGLVVSVFQAATQINEATLSFAPKLLVVAAILFLLGPSMLEQLTTFGRWVFELVVAAGH